jgi:hypothetical protein
VTAATGAYTFTPNATAINALAANTTETFNVTVSDGTATPTATLTVNLTGVNDTPTVAAPASFARKTSACLLQLCRDELDRRRSCLLLTRRAQPLTHRP